MSPFSSASAKAWCSSYIFETAYAHRFEVGGPITSFAVLAVGRRTVAVDVGRRCDDQVGVERQRHRARRADPIDVDLERLEGAPVAGDLHRGKVHDRLAAVERRPQRPALRAVENLERERRALQARLQVRHRAERQIIDADHFVAVSQQALAQMRADEPRRSRHPNPFHRSLLIQCRVRAARTPRVASSDGHSRPFTLPPSGLRAGARGFRG